MRNIASPSALIAALLCLLPAIASADANETESALELFDSGKLLATGGVSNLEGAAGGGLAAWALIAGYGTRDSLGANVHYTYVGLPDYQMHSGGMAIGLFDRVELSYAYQAFDTGKTGKLLGLGEGFVFHQNIVGSKIKLLGDALYDQDSLLPQLAVGVQYKSSDRGAVIASMGGKSAEGVDFYFAATKFFLAQSLLANVTLRLTKANQFGTLGFGGDRSNNYSSELEGSAALQLSRKVAVGAEYRTRPDKLSFARETDAFDVFVSYFLNKNFSATLAYVDLGNIASRDKQRGASLSLQAGL